MAVPKRRTSKRKKRARRTHYKAELPTLQPCPRGGDMKRPHRVGPPRGYHNAGKEGGGGWAGLGTRAVTRVGWDGRGADTAPRVEGEGALLALGELPPTFRIQLVG